MPNYEQSLTIAANADAIFAFASDPENMPKYLSTVKEAHDAGGKADGRSRIAMKGEANGHPYEGEGWIEYRDGANEMTWGSEGQNDYSGKLSVDAEGDGSKVTVTLDFEPKPGQDAEFKEQMGSRDAAIHDSLRASLESLKKQIEEGGGKVASSADSAETVAAGR